MAASSHTGLLTARCDPFGAESHVNLLGGMYPERNVGRIMWHCDEPAQARYRMVCRGGGYGQRTAPDGGLVPVTICPGGHRGQVMALCRRHARDFAAGTPRPYFDRAGRPRGQIGGTNANEMCPRCMWPPEAAQLHHFIEGAESELARSWDLHRRRQLAARVEQLRARMDELNAAGIVHRCPLQLIEVS